MKHIAVGALWTFAFIWMGNYVALLLGVSAVLTAVVAVGAGVVLSLHGIAPELRVLTAPTATNPAPTRATETTARS